jgi:hypothetical protein
MNIESNSQNKNFNFYKHAIKIETIKLDNRITIGEISTLDINEKGDLIVTDRIASKVYLFDKKGHLIRILSPDSCTPGFHWKPFNAKFDKHGNILILNSVPWGYRFMKDGRCFRSMDVTFLAPLHISFFRDGSLLGYYNLDDGNYLKLMNNLGQEKKRFGEFPNEYKRIIYRIEGGGLVADDNDNIYQVNVVSPEIFKYNKYGSFTKSFSKYPSYFKRIEKDFSNNNPADNFKEMKNIMKDKTISSSLFLLKPNLLVVQFYTNKFYGIQICDTRGNYMNEEEIILDKPVINAKFGKIYFVHQPEPDQNGDLPNPEIEVCELKKLKSQ